MTSRADGLDDARALVAEHRGERKTPLAVGLSHIRVTDTRRHHANQHLARTGVAKLDRLDALRLAEGVQHGRGRLDRHGRDLDASTGEVRYNRAMPDVVVVTGAASGIGRATATRLVQDGVTVVGLDRDENGLAARADELGEPFASVAGDVGERASHEEAARVASGLGALTGWVNVAGIWTPTRAHDLDDEALERVLRVNLVGTALGCSVACRTWLEAGSGGSIVNVSSVESTFAFPSALAYEASKGGVDAVTRQVAVEYGPVGIRCNAVQPGAIMTPLAESYLDDYERSRGDDPVVARPRPARTGRRAGGRRRGHRAFSSRTTRPS